MTDDILKKERQREYLREYRSRPDVKEHLKEYAKIYNAKPEAKKYRKEYQREYRKRPGFKEYGKEYRKEYYKKPEVKQRYKEYSKKYYNKPEVREKHKIYCKTYSKIYNSEPTRKLIKSIISHNTKIVREMEAKYEKFGDLEVLDEGKYIIAKNILDNIKIIKSDLVSRGLKGQQLNDALSARIETYLNQEGRLISQRRRLPASDITNK